MVTGSFRVAALDESTWPAYRALIELNNGVFGGCWCLGFHTEGAAKGQVRTFETKRELKHARVLAGTTHAALVFDGDDCVGWAQFGTPAELPRIKSLKAYEAGLGDLPDWRIACCYVGKGHRRAGVSTVAIRGALDLIAQAGGGVVEGYPEDGTEVPAGFLFNGALSTYEGAGFTRDRQIGKHRWVVTKVITAA